MCSGLLGKQVSSSPPLHLAHISAISRQVMSWDFERVIPAHFDAPIAATPATLRPAFNFLAVGTNEVRGLGL